MVPRSRLRLGVVGAGAAVCAQHLPRLRTLQNVRVDVVADSDPERAVRAADRFSIPETAGIWTDVVERDDLDAVVIGTWPDSHCEITVAALEAGKSVLCTSPLGWDLADGNVMAAAARAHPERVCMVFPTPMRRPHGHYIKQLIASGRIGAITAVDGISTSGEMLASDIVTWSEQVEWCGRRVLQLDAFSEALNDWVGPYTSLSAVATVPVTHKRDSSGHVVRIEVPQVVMVVGLLESGAAGVEYHSGVISDDHTPHQLVTIHGLDGTLRYDFETSTLKIARRGGNLETDDVPDSLLNCRSPEETFVDAVLRMRNGSSPAGDICMTFGEALSVMQRVEAVHQSAATGRAVRPKELGATDSVVETAHT